VFAEDEGEMRTTCFPIFVMTQLGALEKDLCGTLEIKPVATVRAAMSVYRCSLRSKAERVGGPMAPRKEFCPPLLSHLVLSGELAHGSKMLPLS
jgi:hypothetical protein